MSKMILRRPSPAEAELATELGVNPHDSRRFRVANAIGNISMAMVAGTFVGSMIDFWPDDELDFRLVYFAAVGVAGAGALVAGALSAKPMREAYEAIDEYRQQEEA